jgi:predicted amidohydrolase YtcJ
MATHQAADVLLIHGQVLTMDHASSVQQAVAIRQGRIQAVGHVEDVQELQGPDTRVIDVQGRTVIPGIIDAHAHMDREGLKNMQPGLEGVRCIADILEVIKREVDRKQPGEWVVTMPIGNRPNYADVTEQIAEGRYPTRWELDSVAPDNPVYIRGIWTPWNVSPGVSVANSRALQLAGIDRHTPPPHSSVVIERDDTGEPTGVIMDYNLYYPVVEFSLMRVVPRFTHEDRVGALRESMQLYNGVGTTTIYEGHGVAPELLRVYKAVWDTGDMTVRSHLVLSPTWTSVHEAADAMECWGPTASGFGFGDDMLRLCGYFIQLRGQPHVARLRSAELPFTGWAGFAESYNTLAKFRALLRLAARHNLRVHTFAATEADLEEVLQAFEDLQAEFSIADRRWVLEHVVDVNPAQLPRMQQLGVVCETIPLTYIWLRGGAYVDDSERAEHLVPHQHFLQHGIPFGMGTDNKPYNPFQTLWAAVVRRERRTGAVIGPQQCLIRMQALHAFTMGGAYFCGVENQRGSLEVGKLADLAVLSDDPLQVPDDQLPNLHAVMTMVGGRAVHDSDALAAEA